VAEVALEAIQEMVVKVAETELMEVPLLVLVVQALVEDGLHSEVLGLGVVVA
jgi:hypothetical protein